MAADILNFPSAKVTFDACSFDWDRAMKTYDSHRPTVGIAMRFGQMTPVEMKNAVAQLEGGAIDDLLQNIDNVTEVLGYTVELLIAVQARLEAVRRRML
jgi:hypothetical protein